MSSNLRRSLVIFRPARATTRRTRTTRTDARRAVTRAATKATTDGTTTTRRELAAKTLAAMALTATPTIGAFAGPAHALSGMNAVKDTREGYEFLYPVGWQEIQVDGQAAVYKDIIEPLESAALNVYPTQRESVREIGTPDEVAKTLVGKALTAPGAQGKVLATSERTDKDGHLYYQFEFVTRTKSYERHALTVVTVTQGKFYTLTTGSSEKRWNKMKERLAATVGSFKVYY